MDTVTQIALGAAVGESTLGRKVGGRASLWGGLCGLLPDLDVLWPFADPVSAFTWHRGYSHSIAVLVLATPVIAWAAVRIHPGTRPFRRGWLLLAFLALLTHPLLEGYYSLLDTEPRVSFASRPDGHELLEPLRDEAAVERLIWFSRGFFSGREIESGEIAISDLRMGLEERLVFSFVVGRREGETIEAVPVRRRPDPEIPPGMWAALGERILGRSAEPACLVSC